MMKSILSIALVAITATAAQAGSLYDGLNDAQKAKINQGEQVEKTQDVAGSHWPRITVLQRVDATPEQLAGIMFDYAIHKDFFEGIVKSTPNTQGTLVTDVDYTMTFPPVLGIQLPDENYTIRDTLAAFGPDGYQITWTLLQAQEMTVSTGAAKFEPLGTSTLVSYTSLISPKRMAAKLIKGMAIDRVHGAVTALKDQVAKERRNQQDRLNAQITALTRALGR